MRTNVYKGRKAHLIDLENIVGSGHVTESAARHVRDAYLACGVVGHGDHVILGISHHNLLAAGLSWPSARRKVRSGRDGADLALQEVMATENLHMRYESCIVVTGDGGFAHPIAALAGLGLPVGVIAPRGRSAAALKLAATAYAEIDFASHAQTSWSA